MLVDAAKENRMKLAIIVARMEVIFGPPTSRRRIINVVGIGEPGM